MFRDIITSMSICLQGTLFERRPRKGPLPDRPESWYYSVEEHEDEKPYLMVAEQYKVRYDFMTRLHTRDAHLLKGRDSSKAGRAKWFSDNYEQCYHMAKAPNCNDPRIAVYYNALGLGIVREVQLH